MKNPGVCVFLSVVLFLSLSQTPAHSALLGPEIDDESDFSYAEGSGKGPEDWWRRKECWRVCKKGKRQSPIELKDINAFSDSSLRPLETNYEPKHAILKNRGHDITLMWPDGGGHLFIDGKEYRLKQCHWHSPAEHIVNGSRADLEMHMVHRTSDDKIAIVAILYKISSFAPDPFLDKLMRPLNFLARRKKNHIRVGEVTPVAVKGPRPYYTYVGSLTTPPCTEDVEYTVYKEALSVSRDQLLLLRNAVHDGMENNSRPVQPINGRWIGLFQPSFHDEHASS